MAFDFDNIDRSLPAVEYRQVGKVYEDGTTALEDLNLTIENGEFCMLVGSSGGGKTTMLKMVNGLIVPTSGSVRVFGTDVQAHDLIQLRRHVGYAVQGSALFPHLTVAANIVYTLNLQGADKSLMNERSEYLIDLVGLDKSYLSKYPDELSGGQQQRVGIARALASNPHLLVMDEPFGAVDSITRTMLQDEMLRIVSEYDTTVVFVTHDVNEALKMGTKIAVMDRGHLQQYAAPDEVLHHPATEYVETLMQTAG